VSGRRIVVIGGLPAEGPSSARVDAYDIRRRAWSRLPDLPVGVDHAMAAAKGGRVFLVGGYVDDHGARRASSAAHVLEAGRWRSLPRMPGPRAAGGAAVVRNTLYVMAGVSAPGRLARRAYALDLRTLRWRIIPGPAPREHLGVAAHAGRVYVLAGRTAGFGSNRRTAEAWNTRTGRWERLPDLPTPHGGCSAAAVAGRVVVVGGEATDGTIPEVEAYDPVRRRWSALPPLEQPRHGLGVAAAGETLYALLGGPEPGLFVSRTATALDLGEG
jgi:non-specific serine/threonine protein kinase